MFEEFDILVKNFDRAIMETITYKGNALAKWQAIQDRRGRTDVEMEKDERDARVAQYRQSIERDEELAFIPCAQVLTS